MRNKWRFAAHILHSEKQLWAKELFTVNFYPIEDPNSIFQPKRPIGRPRLRWDDYIQKFCEHKYTEGMGYLWSEILANKNMNELETEFVDYLTTLHD